MRVSRSVLGIVAGVVCSVGLALSASAGEYSAQPQCGDLNDIVTYYGNLSDFTGYGLTVKKCSQLCKKAASECKDYVGKANACSKKSVSDATGIGKKTTCSTLSGSEKKSCQQSYNQLEKDGRQSYKSQAQNAKQQCMSIRDACISDCED